MKLMAACLLALLAGTTGGLASGPGGPLFPQTVGLGDIQLEKVGEGAFHWLFIKVYDGVLYLDAANRQADPLADVAKRLELRYAVDLSARDFRESGSRILRRSLAPQAWQALQDRLELINGAYQPVQKGDRYALTYVPGAGTTLSLNGVPLVTVPGADFASAYFSIWLGDNGVKRSFREAVLGN